MFFDKFFISVVIFGYSSACSENEIDTDCVNPCNTCAQRGRCDPPPNCQPGCDCKPGFFRDESGSCVPEQLCLDKPENSKCSKNAIFLPCSPLVFPTCENPYAEPDYDDDCYPGCACRPGFLRRKDGQCVSPDRCYSKEDRRREMPGVCQEDEEFHECTPSCKNTCENIHNPRVKCRCGPPGCFCREGLVKRSDGKCVDPKQCQRLPSSNDPAPKCPKNAVFIKCGSPCPPTCDDLQPEPCEEKCTTACYCKPGYLKRKDGVCVRPIDCQPRKKQERPSPKCPENAIFIECGSPCPPTCEDRFPACEENCTKACFCKPGFLLQTKEAKCVKPENCGTSQTSAKSQPKCATDEQFYECTPSCKNTCRNISNPEAKCQCGPPGCFCKEGLVKRDDGKCVRPEQCEGQSKSEDLVTPQPVCQADEQFYECTPICRNTCENFVDISARCYCGPPGCFCKEGLVKRADGKCVPPNQCRVKPQPECGPDEEFYECKPSCKNTCRRFNNPGVRCDCGPPGCFCKKGLVKRSDGKCVPPSECPVPAAKFDSCPENAEFSACGPSCRPTCADPYPAPCEGSCIKGCFCRSGFVEDTDGRCVRLKNCTKKCLQPGEEFQECGSTCPDTCENRGRPPTGSCPYRCNRGCFCKKGLYRKKNGQCVPLKDCDQQLQNFTTTSKPPMEIENTDAVTVHHDFHGCPNRAECETYCKSLGDFIGICIGKDRLHCRCA